MSSLRVIRVDELLEDLRVELKIVIDYARSELYNDFDKENMKKILLDLLSNIHHTSTLIDEYINKQD